MSAAPTGKKHFKQLEKRLAALGYAYSHSSGNGSQWVYTHDSGPDLTLNPGMNENAARQILRKIEKDFGVRAKAPKRNAAAVKERQAAERERQAAELDRLEAERDEIIRRRDALLGGAGSELSNAEIRALEERVAQIEAERRQIERLMAAPVGGIHDSNRNARHRSGRSA